MSDEESATLSVSLVLEEPESRCRRCREQDRRLWRPGLFPAMDCGQTSAKKKRVLLRNKLRSLDSVYIFLVFAGREDWLRNL